MLVRAISLGLLPFEDRLANLSATEATSALLLGKVNKQHLFIITWYERAVSLGRIGEFSGGGGGGGGLNST